ncbi:armadillo-like helical domain-containing protein 3 isoform X2 [Folsomia candida]|nr:armadillo-like helical domain-containing protein 3 isoform X2 [Folsomia candida]
MTGIIDGVVKLIKTEFGYDLLDALMGFENAPRIINSLLNHSSAILSGSQDFPKCVKESCMHFLLMMMTSTEILSKNKLMEYVVTNSSLLECLFLLLSQTDTRIDFGHDCLVMLVLLVNYEKDRPNDCAVRLSLLDDHLTLNGYSQSITAGLSEFCVQNFVSSDNNSGWFHSITSMVGSMFVTDENSKNESLCGAKIGLLVAFYEAAHLNRNFMTTLANTKTDTSPNNTLSQNVTSPLQLPPSNLLVTFMEYTSLIMATQDVKSESSSNLVKLCFIILTCIAEDQYANALMSDPHLVFRVHLHRVPMRHRKVAADTKPPVSLVCALMDLMVEFLMTHLTKRLPYEMYIQSAGIIHRVLCYQKKSRTKISYDWRQLWSAWFTVIKFVVSNEVSLIKKFDIFYLALQIVNMINLFITYGDTFLLTANSYDELYYEIIRCQQTFDGLYSLTARFTTNGSEHQISATKLLYALCNVRAILTHFSPKIDEFLTSQNISTPTEEQIIEVVRNNYESLTLKIPDSFDQFERYSEIPKHASFFTSVIRVVIKDTRHKFVCKNIDYTPILVGE